MCGAWCRPCARRWVPEAAVAKRLFDLLGAAVALLLLAPLMLGVALWIKLDSPGPVFFRQQRVGRHGVPFSIHKFRTMRTQQDLNEHLCRTSADAGPAGFDPLYVCGIVDPNKLIQGVKS